MTPRESGWALGIAGAAGSTGGASEASGFWNLPQAGEREGGGEGDDRRGRHGVPARLWPPASCVLPVSLLPGQSNTS